MDLELNIRPGSIGFTLIWKTIIIFVHAKSSEGCGGASYSWRWLQALGLNLLSQTRAWGGHAAWDPGKGTDGPGSVHCISSQVSKEIPEQQ